MSDSTPITEHLRDLVKAAPLTLALTLFVECDNIDAIHKKLEDDHKELEGECAEMRDFCERVKGAVEDGEDLTLWGVDYAPLPLDADGMAVHVGDMMDTSNFGTVEVEGFIHSAIAFYNYDDQQARLCTSPAKLCHHHKPTVADLLRDMLHDWFYADTEEEEAEIVERFAKRLQLVEVDE